jgi:hypothetical protein
MAMRTGESDALVVSPTQEDRIEHRSLESFWTLSRTERESILLDAILQTHAWHYPRNNAYRHIVSARGIGPTAQKEDLPRLLRPTAQTFKSYIDVLGTPFPQDLPQAFLEWLADQLSGDLPHERFSQFRDHYRSLEALLLDIEHVYADLGFEVSTSSGTSGRSTIMLRDQASIATTVESFYLAFQRYLGMQADHRAIFIMPRHTRIAMVRMASFSVSQVWSTDDRIHFTIPFPAHPDQVRVRAGRTFRPGWRGAIERRLQHPFMNWMNDHYVTPRTVRQTITLLESSEEAEEKVLVFGGWVQLHAIAQELEHQGKSLRLAPGSLLGTGGGLKELYPYNPTQIRQDLANVIALSDGHPIPIRDTYGMAEGNWAAMQCQEGNYHVPPWVYAVTLDDDNRTHEGSDNTGYLAFYDPFGGGDLFPAFFRTADEVRLVNGAGTRGLDHACPCGENGTYIVADSIQRMDLLDEAGCAAQV